MSPDTTTPAENVRQITGNALDVRTQPTLPASRQTVQIKEPAGKLGTPERRLFRHLHAAAYDEIKRGIFQHKVRLADLMVTGHKGQAQIKEAIRNLQETRVEIEDAGSWTSVQVLGGASIERGWLSFEFPARMRTFMQSPTLYHRISLRILYHMRSRFSIILYEILVGYYRKKNPVWECDLVDLHQYLGTQNKRSLQKFAELKRTVLDKACDEISKRAEFKADHFPVKTGKRVTGVQFVMAPKSRDEQDVTRSLLDEEMPLLAGL